MTPLNKGDKVRCLNSNGQHRLVTHHTYTVNSMYENEFNDLMVELAEVPCKPFSAIRFELVTEVEELENTVRYELADGKQLFEHIEKMYSKEQVQGFYEINILKYVTRYENKNKAKDLDKDIKYIERLKAFMYGEGGTHES